MVLIARVYAEEHEFQVKFSLPVVTTAEGNQTHFALYLDTKKNRIRFLRCSYRSGMNKYALRMINAHPQRCRVDIRNSAYKRNNVYP